MTLVRRGPKGEAQTVARSRPSVEQVAYGADGYAWALQQAALIRARQWELIDTDNIADELDALGKSEIRATRSAIALVVHHMLKWDFQSDRRSRSWVLSIRAHRRAIERQFRDNPGLRSLLSTMQHDAYADARDTALAETDLPEAALPLACPYSWDDIMTRPIEWPEQP